MDTTPNLGLRLLVQSQSQKEVTVNEALCRLDAMQAGVLSRSLATPPGSPTDGMSYIVGAAATGIWGGKDGQIAYYAAGWYFIPPKEGMHLWVHDESANYRYDGSQWQNTALSLGRRNALINGAFTIWQRGTSFASPAAAYTADRWLVETGTGGVSIVSRQAFTPGQTDVAGEPAYFLRHAQGTAASTTPAISQKIESVRSFAGRAVTLSFYVRAAAAFTLAPSIIQNFGTGGSPSSAVSQALATQGITTIWSKRSLTFTVPSIAGKTLGTNGDDCLQLRFALPASATFTCELACVQLELGGNATPFEGRMPAEELAACQRYFEKSFAAATAPVQSSTNAGAFYFAQTTAAGSSNISGTIRFAVPKRVTPSVSAFASAGTSAQVYNHTRSTSATATNIVQASETGVVFSCTNPAASLIGDQCSIQFTADAEL